MLFGVFNPVDPQTWINAVLGIVRIIFFAIDEVIYSGVRYAYNIFDILCHGKFLDNEIVDIIKGRVGTILGVIMLFVVCFQVLKLVVDPDAYNDKEKGAGGIIKRVIIVIVMLGLSGYAFDTLYNIQLAVIENNVIPNLILPSKISSDSDPGGIIESELFFAFFNVDTSLENVEANNPTCADSEFYAKAKEQMIEDSQVGFEAIDECVTDLNDTAWSWIPGLGTWIDKLVNRDSQSFTVDYNYIFATACGIYVLWVMFNYTISVGVRMIQMAGLEIISPMAIVSYLSPKKDNMFSKWLKIYISTYINVFLRVAIIDFAIYLIGVLVENFNDGSNSTFATSIGLSNASTLTAIYIKVIMIIAILTFAKKAPDLIKKLLPTGESGIGFGVGKAENPGITTFGRLTGGAVGAGAAMTVGAVSRFNAARHYNKNADGSHEKHWALKNGMALLGGAASGAVRGARNGGKTGNVFSNIKSGLTAQTKADDAFAGLIQEGGSSFGKFRSGIINSFGETKGQMYNRMIRDTEQMANYKSQLNEAADGVAWVKQLKEAKDKLVRGEHETDESFLKRQAAADKLYKDARKATIDAALKGKNEVVVGNQVYKFSDDADNQAQAIKMDSIKKQAQEYNVSHNVKYYKTPSQFSEDLEVSTNFKVNSANTIENAISQLQQNPGESDDQFLVRKETTRKTLEKTASNQYDAMIQCITNAASTGTTGNISYTYKDAAGTEHHETVNITDDDIAYVGTENRLADLETINNREDISNLESKAVVTRTEITMLGDYSAAIANDRAAGVNPNENKK